MNEQQQKMQALGRIAQEKQHYAANLFSKRLNSEFFPKEKLSDLWREKTALALQLSPPMASRIPLADFADVLAGCENKNITLFQFGVMSNAIEAVSANQLGMCPASYFDLVKEVVENIKHYQARINAICNECDIQAEKEISMKKAATLGEKGGLKPVVGEA